MNSAGTQLHRKVPPPIFAKQLASCIARNQIEAKPTALALAFNKYCINNKVKPHTVKKWLLGITQPRSEALLQLASFLDVDPKDLISEPSKPSPSNKVSFEFDFTDQEVITKYLAMTIKQKVTVRLLIDAIADKNS